MEKLRKILCLGMLVLLLALPCEAFGKVNQVRVYRLDLAVGSTTTVGSGTSVMIVNEKVGDTSLYIGNLEVSAFAVQLRSVSGITVGATERNKGGSNSGVTGTFSYLETVVDSAEHWAAATRVPIWNGTLVFTSGTSLLQVVIDPEALGFIRFEWDSGITPMGVVPFDFVAVD